MLGRIAKVFLIGMAVSLLTAAFVAAQAPTTISYQGRLTDAAGQPIADPPVVYFYIYAAATGGSALYTSPAMNIHPDANGVFTVELGPFAASVFDGSKRYLGIKVGSDAEMTPRQVLTSAPYAFNANGIADNSITSAKIASGAVGNSDLANSSVTGLKVSDGSLTRADIADESGLTFHEAISPYTSSVPTGTNTLDSISITAPGAGYVYVFAHGMAYISHISGTDDELRFDVETTRDHIDLTNFGVAYINIPSAISSSSYWYIPFEAHRVFPVGSAGTYEYFVNCQAASGGGNDSYFGLQMTAFYIPSAYGAVDKSYGAPGAGNDPVPAAADQ
jgi:hypothetical protein